MKFKKLYKNITKYVFVGGAAALIDWLIFWILAIRLDLFFIYAASISFVIATFANYLFGINILFISESRHSKSMEVILTLTVSTIGLAINLISLSILINLGVNMLFSKILASGVAFFWNFFSRSIFIFKFR
mgnify:CR=1 FL=1